LYVNTIIKEMSHSEVSLKFVKERKTLRKISLSVKKGL